MTEWMHHCYSTSQFTSFFFQNLGTETICPQVSLSSYVVIPISIASSSFAFTCKFSHVLKQNEGGATMSSWASLRLHRLQGEEPAFLLPHPPMVPLTAGTNLGYLWSSFPEPIQLAKMAEKLTACFAGVVCWWAQELARDVGWGRVTVVGRWESAAEPLLAGRYT